MEKDIIWYPPEELRWTLPNETFQPERFIPYGRRQCEILHEARERVLEVLRTESPNGEIDQEIEEVIMDPAWSHSSDSHYSPMFQVLYPEKIRLFQVIMNRTGPTEVDTAKPVGIRDVSSKIKMVTN